MQLNEVQQLARAPSGQKFTSGDPWTSPNIHKYKRKDTGVSSRNHLSHRLMRERIGFSICTQIKHVNPVQLFNKPSNLFRRSVQMKTILITTKQTRNQPQNLTLSDVVFTQVTLTFLPLKVMNIRGVIQSPRNCQSLSHTTTAFFPEGQINMTCIISETFFLIIITKARTPNPLFMNTSHSS